MLRSQWRRTAQQLRSRDVWRTRLVFRVGALLVGIASIAWLTRRYFPAADGSGIPQAIAMLRERKDAIRQGGPGSRD